MQIFLKILCNYFFMRTIVTGGAGFIGSNLVDALLKRGDEVIVIDDFSNGKEENLQEHDNLKIYKKSILDKSINGFFKDVDIVFHLAALPRVQFSIKYPVLTHDVNVNGTLNLLNLCREFNVKRFVFSSSASVYGDQDILPLEENMLPNPMSPYALHKLIGEHYCTLYNELYGIETASLRYFNVYGPRQNIEGDYSLLIPKFIDKALNGEMLVINGTGENTRDYVYVSDVVDANIKAALSNNKKIFGEVFNIGTGVNKSINNVADFIVHLVGSGVNVKHGPAVVEPKDALADISKSRKLLSYEPEISFENGLKKTFELFKKSLR